ncbi:MAG: adenine deaminase [Chloroflexota bacterium]
MNTSDLVSVAKGDSPADLLLSHARIVNTLTGEIEEGSVAVHGERIAGVGDYDLGNESIDLGGKYLSPALIDGHVHPESSMLHIARYAEAVVPRGVSGIVTDLHEIANVTGLRGIEYVVNSAKSLPLDLYFMVPSCVPATHLETSGARLTSDEVKTALGLENAIGLGEVMNFPGVLAADDEVLAKLAAARGKVIDGHAPGLAGRDLNAYIGCGIYSDHESTSYEEAREKLVRGMYLMIREGSSEKNLEALLPLVTDRTYKRCLFVVDDRSCGDLMADGDIDAVVRKAIKLGLDPIRAIQLATINTAEYFGLRQKGAVAPGYYADLVVLDDLESFAADKVFHHGRLVAQSGKPLFSPAILQDQEMTHTVRIKPFGVEALRMPARDGLSPVIELVPDQIVTSKAEERAKVEDGFIVPDIERDILKLAVVERHNATGNIGLGLVRGFGLQRGALASSIAHDSHNIIVVGTNDADMFAAIREIERLQGGLVVATGGKVEALALPVAGLLSAEPLTSVVNGLENLKQKASGLGCKLAHPFATLSFLALPVIPELRLTDLGLVDVLAFQLVD